MAELVVFGFDNRRQAEEVWSLTRRLSRKGVVRLADGALAWREPDGEVRIRGLGRARSAAVGGAVCGSLVGAVFLAPLLGLALGAGGGAIAGRLLANTQLDEAMVRRITGHLQPGRAAVFVLARASGSPEVVEQLRRYRPMVIKTSLTREREEELVRALRSEAESDSEAESGSAAGAAHAAG